MIVEELRSLERSHIADFWPERNIEYFSWEKGLICSACPGFRVAQVAPAGSGEPWVYVSLGGVLASVATPKHEFVLLSPDESPRHIETLAVVYHYASTIDDRLALGSVLNLGRPWHEESSFSYVVVTRPLPFGPVFENLETEFGEVRFRWLVPVSEQEADLARVGQFDRLEELLEVSGVNVISPHRVSVV